MMMFLPRAVLAAVTVSILLLRPALAEEEYRCDKVYRDVGDKLTLGEHPMGTAMLSFMSRDALADCNAANEGSGVCYFAASNGVVFYADHDAPLETALVGAARLSQVNAGDGEETLIAGVKFGDTLFEVGKKLRTLPENFPAWRFRENGELLLLNTGFCLQADNGKRWSYLLSFTPEGHLEAVEVMMLGYESPI